MTNRSHRAVGKLGVFGLLAAIMAAITGITFSNTDVFGITGWRVLFFLLGRNMEN